MSSLFKPLTTTIIEATLNKLKETLEPFHNNIFTLTLKNKNFRKVIYTSEKIQLALMSILPDEEIGKEKHKEVEQLLFFLTGNGKAVIDNKDYEIKPGSVFIIRPKTEHNFINTGKKTLKLFTIYSPPNHIDGTIHKTKLDADKDKKDEKFGEENK